MSRKYKERHHFIDVNKIVYRVCGLENNVYFCLSIPMQVTLKMSKHTINRRKKEAMMIFASSCVESAARSENVSASEMYKRMKRVGLIEGFILKCYEGLHTQSRQHVTEDVLGALAIWEAKKGVVVA